MKTHTSLWFYPCLLASFILLKADVLPIGNKHKQPILRTYIENYYDLNTFYFAEVLGYDIGCRNIEQTYGLRNSHIAVFNKTDFDSASIMQFNFSLAKLETFVKNMPNTPDIWNYQASSKKGITEVYTYYRAFKLNNNHVVIYLDRQECFSSNHEHKLMYKYPLPSLTK